MAIATKLDSGAWRCRPTITVNGKKVTKSFTVHPRQTGGNSKKAKLKAEALARQWQIDNEMHEVIGDTVESALLSYISDRSAVLSPSTLASYSEMVKYFDSISGMYVQDVDTPTVQRLVNDMAVLVSPKTIKNRIGFLLAALDYVGSDRKFKIRYPQKLKREQNTPDVDEVIMLLRECDDHMRPVICLAAFGTLRRGEICALKQKDISKDLSLISIHADMVLDQNRKWIYKEIPKTSGSIRSVSLPREIIDLLPVNDDPEAFIFDMTPSAVTSNFMRLRDRLGLKCSFHSLRHFAASFRSDIGIPIKYIEEAGGWEAGSKILTGTYDNVMKSSKKKYTAMTNKYIRETFGDEIRKRGSC
jgi:integrase